MRTMRCVKNYLRVQRELVLSSQRKKRGCGTTVFKFIKSVMEKSQFSIFKMNREVNSLHHREYNSSWVAGDAF